MKTLLIGDIHARISVLEDFKKLLEQILDKTKEHEVNRIIFLGDLNDTFGVIRAEVQDNWYRFFQAVDHLGVECLVLVGNHDFATQESKIHSLSAFGSVAHIIDKPTFNERNEWFVPFYRNKEEFEKICSEFAGDVLYCHQSFNGAKFENGFFDPDGADLGCVENVGCVIGGHIHGECRVGNVWYPGAAWQRGFGEVKEKFIWLVEDKNFKEAKPIKLDLPKFINIESDSVEKLTIPAEFNPSDSIRFVASGTAAEIKAFRTTEAYRQLKKSCRLVTDKFTVVGSSGIVLGNKQMKDLSHEQRIVEYAGARKWRTSGARVIEAIKSYFA